MIFERYFLKHFHIAYTYKVFVIGIIDCLPGYIGMSNSFKCPYLSYGIKCKDFFNCCDEQCDVSTGCTTGTTGIVHLYIEVFIIYHQCR